MVGVTVFSVVAFCGGINWGLPSRASDRYLFGGEFPWSGVEIGQLAPTDDSGTAGADVAAGKLDRSQAIVLNATDADRARIVRRYRLFTYQPDEWVTIAGLSKMHPGRLDFDPKLYQYGGVWLYGVGAIFKAASILGVATVSPDVTEYLDRPDEIGRLYVLARLYSVAWGLLGVWLAYVLIRRSSGSSWAGLAGALCFAAMPGVVDLAHEAKPHLACLVATMAGVACAGRYLQTPRRRWWIWTGVCCGLAWGLVFSGVIALAMLPVMGIMRMLRSRRAGNEQTAASWIGPMIGAMVIACAVFAVSNPYLVKHVIAPGSSGGAMQSNMDNTAAMYSISRPMAGFWNVVKLVVEGASMPVAAVGVIGAVLLVAGRGRGGCNDGVWLLAGPAVMTAVVFGAVGADKPGEFGRFLLDIDVVLLLAAVTAVARWVNYGKARGMILMVLVTTTILTGGRYWLGFRQDSTDQTTRAQAAAVLARLERAGNGQVDLWAEPAPYSTPPMDLFHEKIVLVPHGTALGTMAADVAGVTAVDRIEAGRVDEGLVRIEIRGSNQGSVQTPISWAAKPFLIWAPLERIKSAVSGQ